MRKILKLPLLAAAVAMASGAACVEHKQAGRPWMRCFRLRRWPGWHGPGVMATFPPSRTRVSDGVPVIERGLQDITPLMWALSCKSVGGVEALLETGADPNQRAERGLTRCWPR